MLMCTSASMYSLDDPIPAALQHPPNETRKQRVLRLKAVAEAKRLSDQIDEQLKQERERLKRNRDVKLLLLGQAESVIKQFQLMYKPHSFEQEHIYLKTVIYLNVVRSLKHILTTLETCNDTTEDETDFSPGPHSRTSGEFLDQLSPSTSLLDGGTSQIGGLRRILEPLVNAVEPLADHLHKVEKGRDSQDGVQDILIQDVAHMLWTLEKNIKELWDHTTVKKLIEKRKLKLDEGSEFFLNHISRVAGLYYSPTTDDMLHARMGVQEHVFNVDIVDDKTVSWHLYDVGGARGQRHSWVPYFDDIDAVIFVVPISDFDQYLEDPRTNRIEDSLQLFNRICSNRLLKSADIIVILSKVGLLKQKLDRGLKVQNYIPSFGERKNDCVTVIQFLSKHFLKAGTRIRSVHTTDIMDTKAMRHITGMVHESILRRHLKAAQI